MIIIYQIRTLDHKTEHCPDVTCPLCKEKGGIHIHVSQRYIWWFGPMVPSAKIGEAWCDRCDKRIPNLKWNKELSQRFKAIKSSIKTPLRLWRGLIVIASLFVVGYIAGVILTAKRTASKQAFEERMTKYVTSPQPGDIIYGNTGGTLIRTASYATTTNQVYALFKVVKVDGDSIFVVQGNASRIGTAEKPVFDFKDGFWEDLEKETTGYGTQPIIISRNSMITYRYFFELPRTENSSPGKISDIKRPEK
ncbi:MAG TPA: hypothetical protein VM802_23625 [Chitinophaga sp.]|uniref:hypothetical protein n=1 Tax=Chitinophaga sp. TaxID=1869181 RepID=UPI002C1515EF|nr:hypothetical protein [Chitinophaga sp.]HVI47879.1 hypothetical protein [Chitinophaga sp.]